MFHRILVIAIAAIALASCESSDDSTYSTVQVQIAAKSNDVRDPSVARLWNEALLEGIRNDFARPTVHARNLWHSSAAMYDAWAVYDNQATTYLLGQEVHDFTCELDPFIPPSDIHLAREVAISYAMFRLMEHRFAQSPGVDAITDIIEDLMFDLGFDAGFDSVDYANGSAAALGNYIAQCYIEYGMADGSNELNQYANQFYTSVNPPLSVGEPGNPDIIDLDRWQRLEIPGFIDQSGNAVNVTPPHLSPEWGAVAPFSLTENDATTYQRGADSYTVYFDPGPPPLHSGMLADEYKWTHSLVAIWGSHLDPSDGVMVDISPATLGNIQSYPTTFEGHHDFYDLFEGGGPSNGYDFNPVTGQPYTPQIVPRGDYTRVLAEFWADGPNSETPPGHWFVILNEAVNDHPLHVRQIGGAGRVLGPLEWDVKAYFALGGAMHDVAITAWGIKGWYDYIRPVSAIRAMAERGQSSDPTAASYHIDGLPLVDGYIEIVESGDPLAGTADENVGEIKVYSWRGPDYIDDPAVDEAGVGWILAKNWWPYQRPTFVTPPFAGYVSGHSTYSRAAAELMTRLTGSEYFPGGMSGFDVEQNEFLVFEEGPSVSMTLQWAKYVDASDQCSLSRIWGGIHPPADDINGRLIGMQIGPQAWSLAERYFNGTL